MAGPERANESLEAYDRGLNALRDVDAGARSSIRANLLSGRVAPLLVLGCSAVAAEVSVEVRGEAPDETLEGEAVVRLAQTRLVLCQPDLAIRALDDLPSVDRLTTYLRGWRHRVLANALLLAGDGALANRQVEIAWSANAGFGFQRRLILCRMVAHPDWIDVEAWPDETKGSLVRAVAALHRQRHGRRPSECAVCAGATITVRIAHALGLLLGTLPPGDVT